MESWLHDTAIHTDEDFEVTAEMLIHEDVDDESTLEEEEALQEEDEEEIADLQKVCVCACVERGEREKKSCLLYTSPSPRDATLSRMPSSA